MDLIYYHNACPDGWTAAYIANRRWPYAEFKPLDHGLTKEQIQDIVNESTGKDVLMVDYSLRSRQDNDWIAKVAKSFHILDHHKTAQAALEGAPYATFDMNRSGAGLAWDYLFGRDSIYGEEFGGGLDNIRPWWADYTEVRDLWQWDRYPNSREVCAYLGTLPFTVEAYSVLDRMTSLQAADLGKGALAHIEHFVRETVKNVRYGVLENHKVAVLNATYLNCSEIGNELAKNAAFSLTWFERGDLYHFSLRSIGDFDVSAIAKKFGGGGHRNAAGFQLPYLEGREFIDDVLDRTV
jgi:oligoribonuclease NrnB/cAMP/cGMP phosphodiesterase (DHH superfamily)